MACVHDKYVILFPVAILHNVSSHTWIFHYFKQHNVATFPPACTVVLLSLSAERRDLCLPYTVSSPR